MRHSSRQKHLKHVQRSAHIRRMCYFRTVHALALNLPVTKNADTQCVSPIKVTTEKEAAASNTISINSR